MNDRFLILWLCVIGALAVGAIVVAWLAERRQMHRPPDYGPVGTSYQTTGGGGSGPPMHCPWNQPAGGAWPTPVPGWPETYQHFDKTVGASPPKPRPGITGMVEITGSDGQPQSYAVSADGDGSILKVDQRAADAKKHRPF